MTRALVALLLVASGCSVAGDLATRPYPQAVGAPPEDLGAEAVTIPVRARAPVEGWYVDAPAGAPAVVLLHGHTDTRRQMLSRARFLSEAGYAVLMIDLPAHGESVGDQVTFGWTERFAASAAVDFVRQRRPRTAVGVLGISLGGATAALAGSYLEADALVLDSAFSTFEDAVRNRVQKVLGPLSSPVEAGLVGQIHPRLGVPADSLRPVVSLARTSAPTFVIGGGADRSTRPDETLALYQAAPSPKELWVVAGAGHEDLFAVDPEAYRQRVVAFFDAHLR